jgi:hypothetical protein
MSYSVLTAAPMRAAGKIKSRMKATGWRPVGIGQGNQGDGEVVNGLAKGEIVVLYPDDRLNPGMRIKISR